MVDRSLVAVLVGTFTLRFSTGLTGALLVYYLAQLPAHGGQTVDPVVVGMLAATFFVAELLLSPPFGIASDRLGQRRVMQLGPGFGAVAVILTGLTTSIPLLGVTRLLEGGSSAASVPSLLGYIARATTHDEALRGRAVARFELATLAGLGAGLVAAGPLWELAGRTGFFLNALVYGGSWLIYRWGVRELPASAAVSPARQHTGVRRYVALLASSNVWLLAPTWIAINAAIGLWTSQSMFQLVQRADKPPMARNQLLMGGFDATQVSVGLIVGCRVLRRAALLGRAVPHLRRSTIILYGLAAAPRRWAALRHQPQRGQPLVVPVALRGGRCGRAVRPRRGDPGGPGPAGRHLRAHPHDRGAIMGLYSVFLALGQVAGSLVGGVAAGMRGIDGLLAATVVMLAVALLPLFRLRAWSTGCLGPRAGDAAGT